MIFILFIGLFTGSAQAYPVSCTQKLVKDRASCVAQKVQNSLMQNHCTDLPKLLNFRFVVSSCSGNAAGHAPIGGSQFTICDQKIANSYGEFLQFYARKGASVATNNADYVIENAIAYVLIHEGLHLSGYTHSTTMDQQVNTLLGCAGMKSVFSSYNVWANWIFGL